MKLANEIYHHDYSAKFTLEHCWRELKMNRNGWQLLGQITASQKEGRVKMVLKLLSSHKAMEIKKRLALKV